MLPRPAFAYLFERFPSFTQTFCYREVEEMFAQGMAPAVFSIRAAEEGSSFAAGLRNRVQYLPDEEVLNRRVRELRAEHKIHSDVWQVFNEWKERGDKARLYEAAWLGLELRRLRVRHVHAHFAGMAARTAFWVRKFWGIPFSFTGHANDIFCESDFPVSLADLVREARFVVTETDFSRDWLRGKFPEAAEKVVRCYNGIDFARYEAGKPAPGVPWIISVGRCIEKKGFGDLIEACRLLCERGMEFACEIIGDGPLEETLRAQIAAAGLQNHVALAGPQPQEEVIARLRKASVFALPCILESDGGSDNLPTVIMEAMACALPVVSTRVAGVPEMVRDGETGFLVPPHAPAEVAAALERLLKDRARAAILGAAGRALALRKFSTATTTRRLKHLLAARGRARLRWAALRGDSALWRRAFGSTRGLPGD